ncbi:MAG: FAD-dependent thymidylate synthase [Vicinamibacterales bacterium]
MHSPVIAPTEHFTKEEQTALAPYFGNSNSPVFVLTNLPEVVKGALFARYSRSAKSVRRLFLDEFLGALTEENTKNNGRGPGEERAERLYSRVFNEYGDDSVSQLGGAHIACEGISNVLTKILERGRLMAYLEQSTRYVPYTDRPNGQWKYVIPSEITDKTDCTTFKTTLDRAFEVYANWIESAQQYFRDRHPQTTDDPDTVYKAVIRAKALDTLRGLLPAATRSNVGVYGSGQAYEALLLKMQGHQLSEVREVASLMLPELRKVIPAFLQRVDRENRGIRWSNYLANCERATRELSARLTTPPKENSEEVALSDFDPDGEIKVVAAALYPGSTLSHSQLLRLARAMSTEDRIQVLRAYIGDRTNRRHQPGRAFEHATYSFDVLSDYGAFRDLQRHRILTIDWQDLSTLHGSTRPEAIEDIGALSDWNRVMDEASDLSELLTSQYSSLTAQYAVSMAYRIRFYMKMNAREAMHVIELRTAPQGHPAYRRVCQKMHRLIANQAGHKAIAEAMSFVDHSEIELERLESERANERRRTTAKETPGKS